MKTGTVMYKILEVLADGERHRRKEFEPLAGSRGGSIQRLLIGGFVERENGAYWLTTKGKERLMQEGMMFTVKYRDIV